MCVVHVAICVCVYGMCVYVWEGGSSIFLTSSNFPDNVCVHDVCICVCVCVCVWGGGGGGGGGGGLAFS